MLESDQRPVSVAIAIENPLVEVGFKGLLAEWPELDVVGVARDATAASELVTGAQPEVVVAETHLLQRLGQLIDRAVRRPRVLALSDRRYAAVDDGCRDEGVCGAAYRSTPLKQVLALVRTVLDCKQSSPDPRRCMDCPATKSLDRPALPLSAREREVFERIGNGEGNLKIAADLGVSVKTVEAHRENVKAKLGLGSAYALRKAAFAWRRGELDLAAVLPAGGAARARSATTP